MEDEEESFGEKFSVMVDELELVVLVLRSLEDLSKLVLSVEELLSVLEVHSEDIDCCCRVLSPRSALAMSCETKSSS